MNYLRRFPEEWQKGNPEEMQMEMELEMWKIN
jgi:hypothetical protein